MFRKLLGLTVVLGLGSWAGPCLSAEVVEFSDGRYLAVHAYDLQGDFIRLNVDRDSFLVFPVDKVDTIRRNRVVVYRSREGAETGVQTTQRLDESRPAVRTESIDSPRVSQSAELGS